MHRGNEAAKFNPVAAERPRNRFNRGVRLILENSTVCHSRRISLFVLPVDCHQGPSGVVVVVDDFFDNDSDSFVSVSCQGYFLFSTESLILAQDERWRRA